MKVTIIGVFSAVLVLLLAGACSTTNNNQSAARHELGNKGISYTKTGFITAAKYGKTEEVKSFLAAGMDVNANVDGTALIAATASKNFNMVKLLVENGADVNETNYLGSALTAAIYVGNFDIASYLINNGADVNYAAGDGTTPMLVAAQTGQAEMIELLAKEGATVNYVVPESGVTPLIIASAKGHLAAVEQLIKSGANVNYLDYSGISPLVWALLGNHVDVAKMLLKQGANPNVERVMISALAHADTDFIDLLVKKGADINGMAFGKMPYIVWCAKNKLPKGVEILIKNGADIKAVDADGCTALDYALINKEYDLVKILDPAIDISKLPKSTGDPNLVPSKQQFDDTKYAASDGGYTESDSRTDGIDSLQEPKGSTDNVIVPGEVQETTAIGDVDKRLKDVEEAIAKRENAEDNANPSPIEEEVGTVGSTKATPERDTGDAAYKAYNEMDNYDQIGVNNPEAVEGEAGTVETNTPPERDTGDATYKTYNEMDNYDRADDDSTSHEPFDGGAGRVDAIPERDTGDDAYKTYNETDNYGRPDVASPASSSTSTVVPGQKQKTVVSPVMNEDDAGSPDQPEPDPFADKSEKTEYSQEGGNI